MPGPWWAASSTAPTCAPTTPPTVRTTVFMPVATPVSVDRPASTISFGIAANAKPMPMPQRTKASDRLPGLGVPLRDARRPDRHQDHPRHQRAARAVAPPEQPATGPATRMDERRGQYPEPRDGHGGAEAVVGQLRQSRGRPRGSWKKAGRITQVM